MQAANFERRQSNASAACKMFDDALEKEEVKIGRGETGKVSIILPSSLACMRLPDFPCHKSPRGRI